jgi:DNA-binding response OmpR family regulator/nitrogen-specific signal transduction histidine kinase
MNDTIIIIVLALVAVVAISLLVRHLYRRSIYIRNRLQMGRVFTNISHELLTPLTVISASVERLREQEPRFAADYALMELNVERMTRLLQQILETSKSQAGELKLLVSQGDVMEYIRQTALCIEPLMHKNGLTFTIRCTPTSMMGWIDTDKVDKIIYNLLSNAAKYTRTPGNVTLEVSTNEHYDHVIIEVTDTGIGISPEQRRRLFQRFHDGDYRRVQGRGNGLGLALTRDLVYLHGGSIDCESEEGKGTTFTVTLPITKDGFAPSQIDSSHTIDLSEPRTAILDLPVIVADARKQPSIKFPDEDAYHVLIVEDNEELLMLMQTMMSSKYHITTATNGRDAIDVVRTEEPDIIVADVMMPVMDGNELTRELKSSDQWNHLPIILITARTDEEDRKESMMLGADDYINKPFRLGDLQLRINNLVENRRRILRERLSAVQSGNDEQKKPPSADELFLIKANECVMAHLSDADFDRDAFAAEMGASASTLYNRLRALTGTNITTFIRDIRMKEARRLAETQPDLRVSDLAYKVGFRDPKYFATCFKKVYGIQPSEILRPA